jgi:HK97 gp10 family phage protein
VSEFTKSFELTGFLELDRQLATLESKVSKKIVRTAVREGEKVAMKAAKSNALSMVGGNMGRLIARNMALRAFKHQRKGSYGMRLGLNPDVVEFQGLRLGSHTRVSFERGKGAAVGNIFRKIGGSVGRWYIPAALEYGHGNAKPIPFMRKAYDSSRAAMIKKMKQIMKQGIEKAAKRNG